MNSFFLQFSFFSYVFYFVLFCARCAAEALAEAGLEGALSDSSGNWKGEVESTTYRFRESLIYTLYFVDSFFFEWNFLDS